MFFLTNNKCITENQWILKLFVGFLKKEKLLYRYEISFELYTYLKFDENLNDKWFFDNILIFLYFFVIPKDELFESMHGNDNDNEHRINCQLWKFYMLEHFDKIKFIKEIGKDRFKQRLINSIYRAGVFDDEKLIELFSKYKIKHLQNIFNITKA